MKHRKASWSIEGASNIGKLLAAKASKRLNEVVEKYSKIVLPEEKTAEIIQILSASKLLKRTEKVRMGIYIRGKGHLPIMRLRMVEKQYAAFLT